MWTFARVDQPHCVVDSVPRAVLRPPAAARASPAATDRVAVRRRPGFAHAARGEDGPGGPARPRQARDAVATTAALHDRGRAGQRSEGADRAREGRSDRYLGVAVHRLREQPALERLRDLRVLLAEGVAEPEERGPVLEVERAAVRVLLDDLVREVDHHVEGGAADLEVHGRLVTSLGRGLEPHAVAGA